MIGPWHQVCQWPYGPPMHGSPTECEECQCAGGKKVNLLIWSRTDVYLTTLLMGLVSSGQGCFAFFTPN